MGSPATGYVAKRLAPHTDGYDPDVACLDEPTVLTLTLPNGKTLEFRPSMTFVEESEGVVDQVTVHPLKQPAPLGEVCDALTAIIERLGVAEADQALARLREWKAWRPGDPRPQQSSGRIATSDGYDMFFELRPVGGGEQRGWLDCNIAFYDRKLPTAPAGAFLKPRDNTP
ncbi:MAG TPA: hypothetical protein VGE52_06940 [Pirellulales bacterium]